MNQRDTYSAHSQDDEMEHSDEDNMDPESASSVDLTCESESEPANASEPSRIRRQRTEGVGRSIPHYNLGQDSDPETLRITTAPIPHHGRGRPSRSRSKSPPRRSRSPTVPA